MLTRYKTISILFILNLFIFINIISNSSLLISQYKNIPQYFNNKMTNIVSSEKVLGIGAYRWSNIDSQQVITISSKIYYNKLSLIFTEFWDFLDFFSPRLYFLSGDSTALTPENTEPLLTVLFPFWIFGILNLIKHKTYKIFYLVFLNCFVAYLVGQKNLLFLWPTLIAYAYIALIGLKTLQNRLLKYSSIFLISIYWIFILVRIITTL